MINFNCRLLSRLALGPQPFPSNIQTTIRIRFAHSLSAAVNNQYQSYQSFQNFGFLFNHTRFILPITTGLWNMPRTIVYTDGACEGNGKTSARAGIGIWWGNGHKRNLSGPLPGRQTNNRAEIHAVIKAVRQAKEEGIKELTIKTDSQFLINAITKWIPGWKKKGWKKADGKPVLNKEDFQEYLAAAEGLDVKFVHVRGHAGEHGNEEADRLAREGVKKIK